MPRATFSLDEETILEIKRTAARLRKPQSHVVREAIADYAARTDRLSERERLHVIDVLARLRGTKPSRSAADVDRELAEIRAARRGGGRRHRSP
ncbi:MAG: ribbon-helix-helix protein, CopG family [Acidobacteria bacterium]|nr:ribbon-helix-helix protein, CopG family [Acidobacteriota bacterium]